MKKDSKLATGLLITSEVESHFNFFSVVENTIIGVVDFILRYLWTLINIPFGISKIINPSSPTLCSPKAVKPFSFLFISAFGAVPAYYENRDTILDPSQFNSYVTEFSFQNFMLFLIPFILLLTLISIFASTLIFRKNKVLGRTYLFSVMYLVAFLIFTISVVKTVFSHNREMAVYIFLMTACISIFTILFIVKELTLKITFISYISMASIVIFTLLLTIFVSYKVSSKILGNHSIFNKDYRENIFCLFTQLENNEQVGEHRYLVSLVNTDPIAEIYTYTNLINLKTQISDFGKTVNLETVIEKKPQIEDKQLIIIRKHKPLNFEVKISNENITEKHRDWFLENISEEGDEYKSVDNVDIYERVFEIDYDSAEDRQIWSLDNISWVFMVNTDFDNHLDIRFLFEPIQISFSDLITGHSHNVSCRDMKDATQKDPKETITVWSPKFNENEIFGFLPFLEEFLYFTFEK